MIVLTLIEGGDDLMLTVEDILRKLHIPGCLDGMLYLTYAIKRAVLDPRYVHFITKGLYLDAAREYQSTPSRVERAMRFAINTCWTQGGRKKLNQMAGYHLVKRPTNSEFIDLVAFYIRRCRN